MRQLRPAALNSRLTFRRIQPRSSTRRECRRVSIWPMTTTALRIDPDRPPSPVATTRLRTTSSPPPRASRRMRIARRCCVRVRWMRLAGCELHFKAEHLQRVGAFKFRGACNAVWSLAEAEAARGVVTHSSGNHGAALALAARTRGIPCHVVVPENAVAAKLAAIRAYGATLHYCAPTMAAREATCAQGAGRNRRGAGASLHRSARDRRPGHGGAGTAARNGGALRCADHAGRRRRPARRAPRSRPRHCRRRRGSSVPNPRARPMPSIAAARRAVTELVPDTICDGLRGTARRAQLRVAARARRRGACLPTTPPRARDAAVLGAHQAAVEPSSAVALAAVLGHRERFAGQRVGVILSGGNVDLDALASLLANGS